MPAPDSPLEGPTGAPYRPRIIAAENGAYKLNCEIELADSLLQHLRDRGAPATYADEGTWEFATYDGLDHAWRVNVIQLTRPHPLQEIATIVTDWVTARPSDARPSE